MTKTSIEKLGEFGQSVWLDNISRSMLNTGKLKGMIQKGLRGMTSNPTIFDKAVKSGSDYDGQIQKLCSQRKSLFEVYDELTIEDIRKAADMFKGVYEKTDGLDGFVSLEVNPKLAFKTKETIEEARRLFKRVDRKNVMFKVPSTEAGFPAIEELLAEGINVNITLIFSLGQYIKTASSYIKGMDRLLKIGGDPSRVRSVASVFVSRIDTLTDRLIDEKKAPAALKGKAAVANSKLIFQKHLELFSTEGFKRLNQKGVHFQRVLWGSTSTKDPAYSDIKYVTELIGKNTINTMPENTFEAFLDHGEVEENLTSNIKDAQDVITRLKKAGIDIDDVCARLLEDGVMAFEKSFDSLLASIEEKKETLCKKT